MSLRKTGAVSFVICIFLILSSFHGFIKPIYANEKSVGIVNAYILNTREKPTTTSSIVGKLKEKTKVNILGKTGDWYQIESGTIKGHVHSDYVTVTNTVGTPSEKSWITSTVPVLNIRKSPSVNSNKIGTLLEGSKAQLLSQSGEWGSISTDKLQGYVHLSYTKKIENNQTGGGNSNSNVELSKQATVQVDALNIRSQASTQSNVLGILKKNEVVKVYSISEKWIEFRFNNKVAFIYADYVKITDLKPGDIKNPESPSPGTTTLGYVTASSLNVRQQANTNSSVLGTLKLGSEVQILKVDNNWAEIMYNNKKSYVSMSYISLEKQDIPQGEFPSTTKYVVDTDVLNVRKEPTINSERIGQVFANEVLSVMENNGEWLKIQYKGTMAYVAKSYVKTTTEDKISSNELKGKIIVLDAGHGGKDSGAQGNGLDEKNVVLNIALELKKSLENNGATVIMTRSTDKYLTLVERTNISNKSGADLFISIHNNAADSSAASGVETYYNNTNGNSKKSLLLAQSVQEKLAANSEMVNRGVKPGNFWVIKGNALPSVLIEVGFVSNKYDSSLLKSPQYINKTATILTDGIRTYFKKSV